MKVREIRTSADSFALVLLVLFVVIVSREAAGGVFVLIPPPSLTPQASQQE